jgi:hypothetical protein
MNGNFYIDKCLPFGCAISCKIFELFSSFLEWLVTKKSGIETVHHYLDDFNFAGSALTNHCNILMHSFQSMCVELGIPLNQDKSVIPTTCLTFLDLEIDTMSMQIRIPQDKVQELVNLLLFWVAKDKIQLAPLQTLVGKLNFFWQSYSWQ